MRERLYKKSRILLTKNIGAHKGTKLTEVGVRVMRLGNREKGLGNRLLSAI